LTNTKEGPQFNYIGAYIHNISHVHKLEEMLLVTT